MDIASWGIQEWTLAFAMVGGAGTLLGVFQNWKSARRERESSDVHWDAWIMNDSTLRLKNVGSSKAKSVQASCSAGPLYHESVEISGSILGGKQAKTALPGLANLRKTAEQAIAEHGEYSLRNMSYSMSNEAEIVISWRSPRGVPRTQVVRRPHFKIRPR